MWPTRSFSFQLKAELHLSTHSTNPTKKIKKMPLPPPTRQRRQQRIPIGMNVPGVFLMHLLAFSSCSPAFSTNAVQHTWKQQMIKNQPYRRQLHNYQHQDGLSIHRRNLALKANGCDNGKVNRSTSGSCANCIPGFYNDATSYWCHVCPTGYYTDESGTVECTRCALGTFSNITARTDTCEKCSTGKYTNTEGAVACAYCDQGTFANDVGKVQCEDCLAGFFTKDTGQKNCAKCKKGWYSDQLGQTECKACPPGKKQDQAQQIKCDDCGAGTFSQSPSQFDCDECTPGRFSVAGVAGGNSVCSHCVSGKYQVRDPFPLPSLPPSLVQVGSILSFLIRGVVHSMF
jgi:hypothetical protein